MKEIIDWVFLKDSKKTWSTVAIMAWVHGNEFAWIKALDEFIDKLEIENWKVYFIYANLEAIKQDVRFTEKNLNRCFLKENNWETYEENRAKEIMNYLDVSDYLLDLHNTLSSICSQEMLITTHIDFAQYFDVNKVVSHIDDIQKWWSDWYMDSIWRKWFCIECGSINFWDKQKSIDLAKKSIINFLKVTWNIVWEPEKFEEHRLVIKMKYMYKTKTSDFKLRKDFEDFEFIKAWEIIAFDWDIELKAESDCCILFAYDQKNIWQEAFCVGEII